MTKTVSKAASTVTKAVTSTAKAVASTASNVVKAAASTAKTVTTAVKTTVNKVTTAVKTTVTNTVNTVKNVATKTVNAVVSTAKNVYNTAKTAVTTAVNTVRNVAGAVVSTVSNVYNTVVSYVSDVYETVSSAVSQYVSDKVEQVKADISNAWENTKDMIEAGLDLVIEGKQMLAEGIQAAGEWWHNTDMSKKLNEAAENISTAWTNSAIGKTVAAIAESVDKAASVIKEKWESSSVGQWCEKAANAISNFYEEHKVLCNIIIGVAILAACVVAAVVIPGLGCSIFAAMAEEALKGAVIGAITGTMGGAFNGALEYYEENGTLDGSTSKIIESASDGFMKGTAAGAASGVASGAMKYMKNPNGYCFVAGTIVATVLGFAAIETIQAGDYVLAKDVDTGIVSYEPVLQTFVREVDETYTITIDGEEIETTAEHPFYVENEGFVQAQDLEAGDNVETADGDTAEVDSVQKNELDEPVLVYNFEVMDDHTYYVGETGVLVHNKCRVAKEPTTTKLIEGEGDVGTYKELLQAGSVGDDITPHHMPSAEYMANKGVAKADGLCMNVEMPSPGTGGRHRLTATFGRNMTDAQKAAYYAMTPRQALAHDVADLISIYKSQGLYEEIRPQLRQFIKTSIEMYPELFGK